MPLNYTYSKVYTQLVNERHLNEAFYNKTLHPDFWNDDNTFKADIRTKLLTIAKDLAEDVEITKHIRDIHLTGSLANYNYTDFSDLDVHILLDFKDINKDEELVKAALDGKRFIWNERHAIMIHNHEVELYFQDIDEPHKASGLYSLLNDKWVHVPKYQKIEIDERDVLKKAEQFSSDIDKLEKEVKANSTNVTESERLHKVGSKLKERITTMRKDSLNLHGEYGIGNLAFKHLRNTGAIGKLIEITNMAYDNMFSEAL